MDFLEFRLSPVAFNAVFYCLYFCCVLTVRILGLVLYEQLLEQL